LFRIFKPLPLGPGSTRKSNSENSQTNLLVMVLLVSLLACGFPFPRPHNSLPVATIAYSSDAAFLYLAGIVPSSPQITLPSDRPIFPYSIIPGGARNSRELQSALAADPVAAHHYSDFRVQSASLVRLSAARKVYVSYRLGNRVFWTKQKVTLHSGEPVLTDGTHFARARCGNRISLLPGPTSSAEPAAATLGGPVFHRVSLRLRTCCLPRPSGSTGPCRPKSCLQARLRLFLPVQAPAPVVALSLNRFIPHSAVALAVRQALPVDPVDCPSPARHLSLFLGVRRPLLFRSRSLSPFFALAVPGFFSS
jgi:hypothetical protein